MTQTDLSYHAQELQAQRDRGTHPEEDFYRLQVQGNGRTNWINITDEQLAAIVALLADDGS